jgi:hypothetical protein
MTLVKSSSLYSVVIQFWSYIRQCSKLSASCQIHLETLTCVFQIGTSNGYCVEALITDTYDIFALDFEFIYISLVTAVVAVCVN